MSLQTREVLYLLAADDARRAVARAVAHAERAGQPLSEAAREQIYARELANARERIQVAWGWH